MEYTNFGPKIGSLYIARKKSGYIGAREIARSRGGMLPSYTELDKELMDFAKVKELNEKFGGQWWTDSILVYPEIDGVLSKGKLVVDSYKDSAGRTWRFYPDSIPRAALGKTNIGLFISRPEIEVNGSEVTVHSDKRSVIVISNFMQSSSHGVIDRETRVPVASSNVQSCAPEELVWLGRSPGIGVRPIRYFAYPHRSDNGVTRDVSAAIEQDWLFNVAYVKPEELSEIKRG